MKATFVVVGGGIAGTSCAETLACLHPDEPIVLINKSTLVKTVANIESVTDILVDFDVKEVDAKSLTENFPNIHVVFDTIVEINSALNTIRTVKDLIIKYQYVCICTGAKPNLIPQASFNNNILGIRDTESIETLIKKLSTSRTIAIVGNGAIASELAHQIKDVDIHWIIKDNSIANTFISPMIANYFEYCLRNERLEGGGESESMNFGLNSIFQPEPVFLIHGTMMYLQPEIIFLMPEPIDRRRKPIDSKFKLINPKLEPVDPKLEHIEPKMEPVDSKQELVVPKPELVVPKQEPIDPQQELVELMQKLIGTQQKLIVPKLEPVDPNSELVEPKGESTNTTDPEYKHIFKPEIIYLKPDPDALDFKPETVRKSKSRCIFRPELIYLKPEPDEPDPIDFKPKFEPEAVYVKSEIVDPEFMDYEPEDIKYPVNPQFNPFLPSTSKQLYNEEVSNYKSEAALGPDWYRKFELFGTNIDSSPYFKIHYKSKILSINENKKNDEDFRNTIILSNGEEIKCDLIVSATGVLPETNFTVLGFHLDVDYDGGIKVNEFMQSSIKNIYAAGDVCSPNWSFAKHWFPMKLWTQARQMGCYAAKCMSADLKGETIVQDLCFKLFTHSTKLFGYKVTLMGLFKEQNLGRNYEIIRRTVTGFDFVKIIVQNCRMQGAILIGRSGLERTCEDLILNQTNLLPFGDDVLNYCLGIVKREKK